MTYNELITEALLNATDNKLTLTGIYLAITEKHPFYKFDNKTWQNGISHKMSQSKKFVKCSMEKGSYWTLESDADQNSVTAQDENDVNNIGKSFSEALILVSTNPQSVVILWVNCGEAKIADYGLTNDFTNTYKAKDCQLWAYQRFYQHI